ncbi:serine/threonine-protein kinase/endoribonuclease IRE1b-like [Morus notabilis]|uniref:serine/threonine-protein kinase/endoribonuclease IRE1b-like n=1 Tax=Morus notabilis TaxID=981085 RepID=UPI000CED677A|nr:serine/threonine-protein kinase/endoribonuclease IRE1b-like [Morus notabilis]
MLCNNVNKQRGEITISSSEVSCDANDQLEIGEKLVVFLLKVINISGSGTAIYKGSYKDRVVAVKRILRSHIILANQEIANLKAFQQHQNVVRFYGEGRDRDFLYLALELCDCDLNDLIQLYSPDSSQNMTISSNLEKLRNNLGDVQLWKENNGRPSPLLLKLMRDMVSGLVVVHDMGIIHRDLKPQNILIIKESSTLCAKISDMGISRKLRDNKASLTKSTTGCGTTGWKAKEWLLFERQTLAMDLFSLGCLLFFCITHGRHPFGDHDERNRNIRNDDAQDLYLVQDFPEAFHLISLLLKADHNLRPKAIEVLHHPLFWNAEKRLSFFRDTSDRVSKNNNLFEALESTADTSLGTEKMCWINVILGWNKKVHAEIIMYIFTGANGAYEFSSVRDLLRLIGYILNHYQELPNVIQNLVGSLYEGIDDYFTRRFPLLLIEVYKVVCLYKEDECLKKYFNAI